MRRQNVISRLYDDQQRERLAVLSCAPRLIMYLIIDENVDKIIIRTL